MIDYIEYINYINYYTQYRRIYRRRRLYSFVLCCDVVMLILVYINVYQYIDIKVPVHTVQ